MFGLSSISSYFLSFFYQEEEVVVEYPKEFDCPITLHLMIRPHKTNCEHVFEELALKRHLRYDMHCPICRRIIVSAIPDTALALRIQNEFKNHKRYFTKVKKELYENPLYIPMIKEPMFPKFAVERRSDSTYSESYIAPLSSVINRSTTDNTTWIAIILLKKIRNFFYPFVTKKFYEHLFNPGMAPRHPESEKLYYSGFYGCSRKISHFLINQFNRVFRKSRPY